MVPKKVEHLSTDLDLDLLKRMLGQKSKKHLPQMVVNIGDLTWFRFHKQSPKNTTQKWIQCFLKPSSHPDNAISYPHVA